MSSYVRFVLKHKQEDSSWGDVAKDISIDPNIKRTWNWKAFNKYIENKACLRAYSIMEEMRDAYDNKKICMCRK